MSTERRPPAAAMLLEPLQSRSVQRIMRRLLDQGLSLTGLVFGRSDGLESVFRFGRPPRPTGRRLPPSQSPEQPMAAGLWRITDHLCRDCLGRMLERMDGLEAGTYHCSICGAETTGAVETLCACGARLPDEKDQGLRCVRNPKRSFEYPHEIVATRVALDAEPGAALQPVLSLRKAL